ncbi:MAG: prepilin-type N-terminal cleavage/methylation domain-containing protein, partial [Planctomycetota bacterium]
MIGPRFSTFGRSRTGRHFGFTLIEMMVALSITAVLILLVNRIFNSTTRAINLGADTSTILAHSRTINDQLYADAQKMLPAKGRLPESNTEPAGLLIIVQQLNGGTSTDDDGWVLFPPNDRPNADPEDWTADADGDGTPREVPDNLLEVGDYVHSSQLAFFRDASRVEASAAGSTAAYESNAAADFARVWFGHSARFDPEAASSSIVGNEIGEEFNQLVTDLVMGRQALLILDQNASFPDGSEAVSDTATGGTGDIYARPPGGAPYDTALNAAVISRVDRYEVEQTGDELWQGQTDALRLLDAGGTPGNRFLFPDLFEREPFGAGVATPGILEVNRNYPAGNPANRTRVPGVNALNGLELPTEDYKQTVLGWAFLDEGRRLLNRQFVDYPFTAEDVSQTHTHFVPYVSDIIIDFAADIVDDYTYDRTKFPGGSPDPGASFDQNVPVIGRSGATTIAVVNAPDGLPDGRPDEYVYVDGGGEVRRAIKWYNAVDYNPTDSRGVPVDPTRPITWPIPRDAPYVGGNIGDQSSGPYHTVRMNGTDTPDSILYGPTGAVSAGGGLTIAGPVPSQRTTPGPSANEFITQDQTLFPTANTLAGTSYGVPFPPLVGIQNETGTVGDITPRNGSLASNVRRRAVFVFGHTPDGNFDAGTDLDALPYKGSARWWPYLIRIRYRLHDGNASYTSGDEL